MSTRSCACTLKTRACVYMRSVYNMNGARARRYDAVRTVQFRRLSKLSRAPRLQLSVLLSSHTLSLSRRTAAAVACAFAFSQPALRLPGERTKPAARLCVCVCVCVCVCTRMCSVEKVKMEKAPPLRVLSSTPAVAEQ